MKFRSNIAVASLLLVGALAWSGCSSSEEDTAAGTGAVSEDGAKEPLGADGLPAPPDVAEFFAITDKLDLNDPSIEFNDGTGGMSINLEYKSPTGARGDFLSNNPDGNGDNSAGHPEGQILAYNLSRVFGFSKFYGRARWYKISGRAKDTLASLASKVTTTNKHVLKAKGRIAVSTAKPEVEGSLSVYGASKPLNLNGMEASGSPNGVFNTGHALAKLIVATNPAAVDREIKFGKDNAIAMNEVEAGKMLSTMFIIDALTEQFDRFSGGNIQMIEDGGIKKLVAFDNGGAGVPGWGGAYEKKYLGWTTRFDRRLAESVIAMNKLVNGGGPAFLGFATGDDLLKALGLRVYKTTFKKHLANVAAHIEATVKKNGDKAYF